MISVSAEGYNPDEDNEDDAKVVYPKSKEQKEHLAKVISNIVLFSSLDKVSKHIFLHGLLAMFSDFWNSQSQKSHLHEALLKHRSVENRRKVILNKQSSSFVIIYSGDCLVKDWQAV